MRSFNSADNYANYITTEDYQMEKLIKLLDKTNSEVHKKDQSFMGPVFSRSIKKNLDTYDACICELECKLQKLDLTGVNAVVGKIYQGLKVIISKCLQLSLEKFPLTDAPDSGSKGDLLYHEGSNPKHSKLAHQKSLSVAFPKFVGNTTFSGQKLL